MEIGDRIKMYESLATSKQFIPYIPVIVRIDGRAFHTFTKYLEKPFDKLLVKAMDQVTLELCEETGAQIGYTQSDEITLVLYESSPLVQLYFNGKIQKIISVLSSFATLRFNEIFSSLGGKGNGPAMFDCRAFNVPSLEEAANCLLWRELDATRNSVQMLARFHFSHKECENKGFSELNELLFTKGVNYNNLEPRLKRGQYFIKKYVLRKFEDKLTGKENFKTKREYDSSILPIMTQLSIEERVKKLFGKEND